MDYCRLCGARETSEHMHKFNELLIEMKLEKTFNIRLSDDCFLPQTVCRNCIEKLDDCVSFLELIEDTQMKLLDSLSQQFLQNDIRDVDPEIKAEEDHIDFTCETFVDSTVDSITESLTNPSEVVEKHIKNESGQQSSNTSSFNTSSRWNGTNPTIKVEDIFIKELTQGIFSTAPDALELSNSEKNSDGTVNEAGKMLLEKLGWLNYEWRCVECNNIFNSSKCLEDHFKFEHNLSRIVFACMDCNASFKSYFSLQNHVIDLHRPCMKFFCDICNEFRFTLIDLYEHRKQYHHKHRNTCIYCGHMFDSGFNLKQHVAVHIKFEEDELYHCDLCDYQVHTKYLIKHHITYNHVKANSNLVCEQCGKICKRLSDMRSHQLVHTSERPYGCDLCELRFKSTKQLRSHKKTHFPKVLTEECSVCEKKFLTKGKLNRHFRMHTNDFAFTCEFCGRKFKYASGFETHRRIHTGERPYVCTYENCGQKFIDWPNMNKHMKNKHSIDNSTRKKKVYLDHISTEVLL